MKKNLIALAIFGAFSGAALAQSNVTLYGILDVNFQYNDPDASGASSVRGIGSGHQSGSRWGIRGSEALSPNLNAVFTLEGGYSTDTGAMGQAFPPGNVAVPANTTTAQRLFGRQVWGGLAGGWGTIVAGRVATFSSGTGSFDMFGNVDPFLTGFGDSSLGSTFTSAAALRVDNAALYQSPSFGGFKFGAGYSFQGVGSEAAGSGNNNRVWFLGANFARGPFFAAVTYDTFDIADAGIPAGTAAFPAIAANVSDQKSLQIGATFDLKFLKLHGAYAKEDDVRYVVGTLGAPSTSFVPTFDSGADADAWMAGVTVPLLGGALLGSYQRRNGDSVDVCTGTLVAGACPAASAFNRSRDVEIWAVAYTYPLSRRTNLYINYSDADVDNRSGPVAGGTGVSTISAAGRKQYTAGFRHLF